jgi:hypothetical protein
MATLQKAAPRWLTLMNRPTPPAPPPLGDNPIEAALHDHQALRDNYANVVGQLTEAHDLLREVAHQNEALEKTIAEDRTYYQGEIDRLKGECAELMIFRTQIRTRLSTIVEVILATDRAAQAAAVARPTEQTTHEEPQTANVSAPSGQPHDSYAPVRRAIPRFVETEAEAAEVRRVTAGIVGNGTLPMNIYGEKE